MGGHYWQYAYTCPYYTSDDRLSVICEHQCAVRFYSMDEAKRYLRRFCACKDMGWKDCTIAQMLNQHYEEVKKT